ncbi:mitochondrial arginine transporter BAC2 isoform X2 [Asparagus officinalis]|uniref:mitochondrial arginine transporter BAC2 isoform X2 n=1 Tax=Asparagus officinalis TaxID=4686 RepID=UPI00098E23B0|nr:mitochondrial arginine transporter BAC2 isoform X2 [Asparagus officinalis]
MQYKCPIEARCHHTLFFKNAVAFQVYAVLTRALNSSNKTEPPPYSTVALAGIGTGALQSLILSPVELVKIQLQLQTTGKHQKQTQGPMCMAKKILRTEGLKGIYRGLSITVLRDAPAHGVYFWSYEFAREKLYPGCRKSGQETLATMLFAGGLAGVASWVCCYPLDVIKSRIQAQSASHGEKYQGIVDCLVKSVRDEGYPVLWRGLGTAVARAFIVNGAIFSAYELGLRFMVNNSNQGIMLEETVQNSP